MTEKSEKPAHLGIKHFLDFMYGGHPEWSLFAVKAPIEEVSASFAELRKAKRVANVPCKPPNEEELDAAIVTAIVQVKDNPWTVVFRSLFNLDSELEAVPEEAKALSASLKTRAVTFMAEDTSCASGYEIFEDGNSVESAEWEGDEFFNFESATRKKPRASTDGDKFANKVFCEEGIYLPCCFPQKEKEVYSLAVEKESADAVMRVDFVETVDEPKRPSAKKLSRFSMPAVGCLFFAGWIAIKASKQGWTPSAIVAMSIMSLGFLIAMVKRRGQRKS